MPIPIAQALPVLAACLSLGWMIAAQSSGGSDTDLSSPGNSQGKTVVQLDEAGETVDLDFGDGGPGVTLYDVVVACGEVTPLLFQFDSDTARGLRKANVRVQGQKNVHLDDLARFLTVVMLISDYTVTNQGTEQVPILEIQPYFSCGLRHPSMAGLPYPIQSTATGYEISFLGGQEQLEMSLMDFMEGVRVVTRVGMTWSEETEEKLMLQRPQLMGRRTISKDGLVTFLDSVLGVADLRCKVLGNDAVSVLHIGPAE